MTWSGATYYFRAAYQGANLTSGALYPLAFVSIQVPSSAPASGDQYAVLLNEMDAEGYLDQIGLSSDYGCSHCGNSYDTWSIAYEQGTYSATQGCGYSYNALGRDAYGATGLTPDDWYTFLLYLNGASLVFKVIPGQGNMNSTPIWSTSTTDTATTFEITPSFGFCNGGGAGTGTNSNILWEEVISVGSGLGQNVPRWDFEFAQTTAAYYSLGWNFVGQPVADYVESDALPGGTFKLPQGYAMDFSQSRSVILVANLAYAVSFSWDTDSVAPGHSTSTDSGTAVSAGLARTYGYSHTWHDYCLNSTCAAGVSCTPPSGWGYAESNPTDYPGTLSIWWSVPLGTSAGLYDGVCNFDETTTTPNMDTSYIWYITVT